MIILSIDYSLLLFTLSTTIQCIRRWLFLYHLSTTYMLLNHWIIMHYCSSYYLSIRITLSRLFLVSSMINGANTRFSLVSAMSHSMGFIIVYLSVTLRSVSHMRLYWLLLSNISIGISRVTLIAWFLLIGNAYISWSIFWLRCILKFRIIRYMIIIYSRASSIMSSI